MAATAPPHSLPVAHGDCLEFTCTVAAIFALESPKNMYFLDMLFFLLTEMTVKVTHMLAQVTGKCRKQRTADL